ncbi:DUF4738 domain-containing protein [uncultured Bacteroides sp.]|uniref:DUF4738 domain-containing protein n=1 Tax=uncultured Bacteroides sp. TaxID=162156 RepID=UPI002AA78977|nr:DUF4738 domain-containing protein [uncultured Bacteroides sp.]
MKKISYLLLLPMVTAFVACSAKKDDQKEARLVLVQDSIDARGLQRMPVSKSEQNIKYKGKEYHYSLSCTPDESLPHVASELGDVYVDNQIVLKLTRGNESVFNKTFTKNSFVSVVDEDFLSKSILEGMVYDKTTPQGIVFAASVSYPQTDLYVPVSITITADGKMSMVKDEQMEDAYPEDSI